MLADKELLEKCLNQDRRAQYQLYRNCYSILMSICSRYEKNKEDAESLLNLGFLKVVTKIDKYNPDIPFEAWIRRIMINTIIDEFRKNKKQNDTIEYTNFEDQHYNKSIDYNEADKQFDAEELEKMLRKLPTVSQKVFNLHVIDGYSHKEIGDMLNISVGTSKWHVANARKILKEMIYNSINSKQSITA